MTPTPLTHAEFARRVLIVAGVAALMFIAWHLAPVLLLVFGSVLLALVLRMLADALERHLRLPSRWALTTAPLLIGLALISIGWFFGAELRTQSGEMLGRLREAWQLFEQRLGFTGLGDRLLEALEQAGPGGGMLAGLGRAATSALGVLANVLIVIVGGVYFAMQPRLYRDGLIQMMPHGARDRAERALDATGEALRLWLLGQLMAMAIVGVLTGLGLWLAGVPSALALGLLMGLMEFVPFLGPWIAAVPAVLIALSVDTTTAFWAGVVIIVVQQIEANVITPMMARRMVDLPLALTLFSIIAFALVFGVPGLLFAAPLTVATVVLVKTLWIQDTLGDPTELPGDSNDAAPAKRPAARATKPAIKPAAKPAKPAAKG